VPKRFDVTTKSLLESHPEDWLKLLGIDAKLVEVIDADLSTVVADADKALLLRVGGDEILNIEFQSTFEIDMIERFLEYCVLFFRRKKLPVRTVVVLLRSEADRNTITGTLELTDSASKVYLTFHYDVVRLWRIPVERLLSGGMGTLPLAPLADLGSMSIETVIDRIADRFTSEISPSEAAIMWTSTYLLLGLRFPSEIAVRLIQGVRGMRESTTYQAILQEGIEKGIEKGIEQGIEQGEQIGALHEARSVLQRIGSRRLGQPSEKALETLIGISDLQRLNQLIDRVLDVETWAELLSSLN